MHAYQQRASGLSDDQDSASKSVSALTRGVDGMSRAATKTTGFGDWSFRYTETSFDLRENFARSFGQVFLATISIRTGL